MPFQGHTSSTEYQQRQTEAQIDWLGQLHAEKLYEDSKGAHRHVDFQHELIL